MEKTNTTKIIDAMFDHDAFSKWMGMERVEEAAGYSKLKMTVRDEMLNGFYIAHGGITYSLADSAFAFASNSRGQHAVSIETSISHLRSVKAGDVLTAEAVEEHFNPKIAQYAVKIWNQNEELVALFKGTVYRKSKNWEI
jgi:acyl-CoA thioesterase